MQVRLQKLSSCSISVWKLSFLQQNSRLQYDIQVFHKIYKKGGVEHRMIKKLKVMINQANYGKKFAKQCKDEKEVIFFEKLEVILQNTLKEITKLINQSK